MLLDFILCDCRLRFHFPSVSLIFMPNPGLYMPISPCSLPNGQLSYSGILQSSPVGPYHCASSRPSVRGGDTKRDVRVDLNGWVRVCVRDAILVRNIYCSKPNPKPNAHSDYWFRSGLEARAPRINLEYDLVTAISIRPLTQSVTCKIGSSSFTSMIRIKLASTTSASFPVIPSTKKTNGEKFLLWS